MKVKEWLKNNSLDFSVTNNNTTILTNNDIKFLLKTKYGMFDVPEDNIEDNNELYTSYRTMILPKIIEMKNFVDFINTYDPITDEKIETVTNEYGHVIDKTRNDDNIKITTNNLTQTNDLESINIGTDNHALSNTKSEKEYPFGASGSREIRSTSDTGSDNESVDMATANTGTISNTGTVTDEVDNEITENETHSGTDTVTKAEQWTNNNLYNELIENKFKYNTEFSLINFYLDGFKDLVLYIDNDIWG